MCRVTGNTPLYIYIRNGIDLFGSRRFPAEMNREAKDRWPIGRIKTRETMVSRS